jgi:hypothetical protein
MEEETLASPGELYVVGLIGAVAFTSILVISSLALIHGVRSKSTQRFYMSIVAMCALECPRYMLMIVMRTYSNRIAYAAHMIAGTCFFAAFSIVCRQWSGLLQLGTYSRAMYGVQGLLIANVFFGLIDLIGACFCLVCVSLNTFFESVGFELLTTIEGEKAKKHQNSRLLLRSLLDLCSVFSNSFLAIVLRL